MSYIINNTSPYASIKLTEKGRERLALGALDFAYWAIGDSEINYDREDVVLQNQSVQALSGTTYILRPKDRQPNLKYYVTTDGVTNLNVMQPANIAVIKAIVNNEAEERGFFNPYNGNYLTISGSTYIVSSQNIPNSNFSGGTSFNITGLTYSVGDFILISYVNDSVSGQTNYYNILPIPNLWYQIENSGTTSDTLIVDRELPNLSGMTGTSLVIVYHSGEVWDDFGGSTTTAYWDSGTLAFDSCCDTSCSDVDIWNMNNPWCEDIAGIPVSTGGTTYESYQRYGSYRYLGTKYPYLNYDCLLTGNTGDIICDTPGLSTIDSVRKSISIIHYTNNTISNFYGEFFYIDNANSKTVTLELPEIMYHRRAYATETGVLMGMTFLASGSTKYIDDSDIEYIDLIEDPSLVSGTVKAVGKVFPQLKLVVIDDDDLVMAMSYKSNRNWTLPSLAANLVSPSLGSVGLLDTDKTMYLTYILENNTGSGMTTAIQAQNYTKISNTTPTIKDVQFRVEAIDLLPYMRKIEKLTYDGLGFYAYNFKVMYQIVDEPEDRPLSDQWKIYDYTTSAITSVVGETIDPLLLENQNPTANGFLIDSIVDSATTFFDVTNILNMPTNTFPDSLQLGDERFFYGNLKAYIGATIFKTLFKINVDASQYQYTSNPTRDTTTQVGDLKITDVGIYDSDKNLVVIAKMSKPVDLTAGNTIMLELSMDF